MKVLRALIIDDEWLIRLELKQMLQALKSIRIVGEAATVAEAIHLTTTQKPDLVFLDLQLGDGSADEFLSQVKDKFSVIFVTAFESDLPKVMKYPALACLSKPINKEKLFSVLKALSKVEGVQV